MDPIGVHIPALAPRDMNFAICTCLSFERRYSSQLASQVLFPFVFSNGYPTMFHYLGSATEYRTRADVCFVWANSLQEKEVFTEPIDVLVLSQQSSTTRERHGLAIWSFNLNCRHHRVDSSSSSSSTTLHTLYQHPLTHSITLRWCLLDVGDVKSS